MGSILAAIGLLLVGGALIETPIVGDEFGFWHIVFGIFCGAPFIILGVSLLIFGIQDVRKNIQDKKKALEEQTLVQKQKQCDDNKIIEQLNIFKKHYSSFFESNKTKENEPVQWEVTQLYRNMMQLHKNRLNRLGISLSLKSQTNNRGNNNGLTINTYTDGRYNINELKEDITYESIYKKGDDVVFNKKDKDTAFYTVISANQVGSNEIICPNCGGKTNREALLDGCDYCKTKFTVEDLRNRIDQFSIRTDYEAAYAKYMQKRERLLSYLPIIIIGSVILGFTVYAIVNYNEFVEEGTGIILALTASIFAIIVTSAVFIAAIVIVYMWVIAPIIIALSGVDRISRSYLTKLKNANKYDKKYSAYIKEYDPNFSICNFYSNVQNKICSIIYADSKQQINAFTNNDLTDMYGQYDDVIDAQIKYMAINSYYSDKQYQHINMSVNIDLLKLRNNKCKLRHEKWHLNLIKDAQCKSQIVCAPAIMKCSGCGSSIDLLQGKICQQCGREIDLVKHDWVIARITKNKW